MRADIAFRLGGGVGVVEARQLRDAERRRIHRGRELPLHHQRLAEVDPHGDNEKYRNDHQCE